MQRGGFPPLSTELIYTFIFNHPKFSLVEHHHAHTEKLWPILRSNDVLELSYESGLSPKQVLIASVGNGEIVFTLLLHEQVMGIMGIGRSNKDPRGGKIWFLGSEQLDKNIDYELIRQSPCLVALLMENFEIAFNFVSEENTASMKWLDWARFEYIRRIPEYGIAKKPFWLCKSPNARIKKNWDSIFNSRQTTGA